MKLIKFYVFLIIFVYVFSADTGEKEISTISESIISDLPLTDLPSTTNSDISDTKIPATDSTIISEISDTSTDSSTKNPEIYSPKTNLDILDTSSSTLDSAPTTTPSIPETIAITESLTNNPVIIDLPTKNPVMSDLPTKNTIIIDLPTEILPGNSTETIKPRIILLGFGLFRRPIRSLVTFRVYFKRFFAPLLSKLLHFTVNVNYLRRLRVLEEQRVDCVLITAENDDYMIYNCSAPVDPNRDFIMSANDAFIFGDGIQVEFIISSYANSTMKSLSSQTDDIFANGILTLTDSTLTQDGNTFIIEGNLMEDELNDNQVVLFLDADGNGNLINVKCKVNDKGSKKYQLVCTSNKRIKAHLNGVIGRTSVKPLLINMKNGTYDLVDLDSSSNHIYIINQKKNSGGLSSGGLISISIVCFVALIATIIIVIIWNRRPKLPLEEVRALEINSLNSSKNNIY